MKAKCNQCEFTGEDSDVRKHCKSSNHVMIDGEENYHLTDTNEVIGIWKKAFFRTITSRIKEDWDYLRECTEIDNKELNKIHGDVLEDNICDYTETKLKNDIITQLQKLSVKLVGDNKT